VWVRPGSQYDQRRQVNQYVFSHKIGLKQIAEPILRQLPHWVCVLLQLIVRGHGLQTTKKMHASGITDAERPFAFIPLNLNDTTDLTARLVEAVRAWESQTAIQVDGITTLDDELLAAVCCAALDLSLSVPGPVDAIEACVDKFQTRKLLPWNGLPRLSGEVSGRCVLRYRQWGALFQLS